MEKGIKDQLTYTHTYISKKYFQMSLASTSGKIWFVSSRYYEIIYIFTLLRNFIKIFEKIKSFHETFCFMLFMYFYMACNSFIDMFYEFLLLTCF